MTRTEELTSEIQQICSRYEWSIRYGDRNFWVLSESKTISRCLPDWAKATGRKGTYIPDCIYSQVLRAYNSIWSR